MSHDIDAGRHPRLPGRRPAPSRKHQLLRLAKRWAPVVSIVAAVGGFIVQIVSSF